MSEDRPAIVKPVISGKLLLVATLCWGALFLFGFVSIYRFAAHEGQRDEQQWQRQIQLTGRIPATSSRCLDCRAAIRGKWPCRQHLA